MLPISSASGNMTPFSDALFTSTSAVCVTMTQQRIGRCLDNLLFF
jgi:hypothetical protein